MQFDPSVERLGPLMDRPGRNANEVVVTNATGEALDAAVFAVAPMKEDEPTGRINRLRAYFATPKRMRAVRISPIVRLGPENRAAAGLLSNVERVMYGAYGSAEPVLFWTRLAVRDFPRDPGVGCWAEMEWRSGIPVASQRNQQSLKRLFGGPQGQVTIKTVDDSCCATDAYQQYHRNAFFEPGVQPEPRGCRPTVRAAAQRPAPLPPDRRPSPLTPPPPPPRPYGPLGSPVRPLPSPPRPPRPTDPLPAEPGPAFGAQGQGTCDTASTWSAQNPFGACECVDPPGRGRWASSTTCERLTTAPATPKPIWLPSGIGGGAGGPQKGPNVDGEQRSSGWRPAGTVRFGGREQVSASLKPSMTDKAIATRAGGAASFGALAAAWTTDAFDAGRAAGAQGGPGHGGPGNIGPGHGGPGNVGPGHGGPGPGHGGPGNWGPGHGGPGKWGPGAGWGNRPGWGGNRPGWGRPGWGGRPWQGHRWQQGGLWQGRYYGGPGFYWNNGFFPWTIAGIVAAYGLDEATAYQYMIANQYGGVALAPPGYGPVYGGTAHPIVANPLVGGAAIAPPGYGPLYGGSAQPIVANSLVVGGGPTLCQRLGGANAAPQIRASQPKRQGRLAPARNGDPSPSEVTTRKGGSHLQWQNRDQQPASGGPTLLRLDF